MEMGNEKERKIDRKIYEFTDLKAIRESSCEIR